MSLTLRGAVGEQMYTTGTCLSHDRGFPDSLAVLDLLAGGEARFQVSTPYAQTKVHGPHNTTGGLLASG